MKQSRTKFTSILLILTLALLLAACGSGDEEQPAGDTGQSDQPVAAATDTPEPAPTDTPVPPTDTPIPPTDTPEPEPTDTPEPEPETPLSFASPEDVLKSYRSTTFIEYNFTSASGEAESFSFTVDADWAISDSELGYDTYMVMSGLAAFDESGEVPDEMEIYIVGDTSYMNIQGEWITFAAEEMDLDDLGAAQIRPEDFFDGLEGLKREGKETINGVEAVHYSFDNMTAVQGIFDEALLGVADAGDIEGEWGGEIWVAEDGDWPVKMVMNADITFTPPADSEEEGGTLLMTLDMEITDVNADIVINAPEGAPQPGQFAVPGFEDGEFPLPPNTTLEGAFGGIVSLISESSEDEVNAFYESELTALGWAKEEGFIPTYTKDGISFTLIVSPADDGSGTNIMIMAE